MKSRFLISSCLIFLSAGSVFGQFLYGIKGGAALTNSVLVNPDSFTFDSARKYIVGGDVEYALPFGLSIEGDVLYHPFDLEVGTNPPPGYRNLTLYDYKVFDFPVLLKARLTNGFVRPYFELGPSFRANPNGPSISHYGLATGFGVEFRPEKFFRISPEIRYTRWAQDSLITVNGNHVAAEQLNQLTMLMGVTF